MNKFNEMMLAEGFKRVALGKTERFLQPEGVRYEKIFRGTITEVCFYPDCVQVWLDEQKNEVSSKIAKAYVEYLKEVEEN